MVSQGDVYWTDLGVPIGSEPGYYRPVVIVQNDLLNESRIPTVIVCPLATNMALADIRGNVLLDEGEGGLPQASVANVTAVATVDKRQLDDLIGTLSRERVREIVAGIHLVISPARR